MSVDSHPSFQPPRTKDATGIGDVGLKPIGTRGPEILTPTIEQPPPLERAHQRRAEGTNKLLTRRELIIAGGGIALLELEAAILGPKKIAKGAMQSFRRFLGKPVQAPMEIATTESPTETSPRLTPAELVDEQIYGDFTKIQQYGFTLVDKAGEPLKEGRIPEVVGIKLEPASMGINFVGIKMRKGIEKDAEVVPLSELEAERSIPDMETTGIRVRGEDSYFHKAASEYSDTWIGFVSGARKEDTGDIEYYFSKPTGEEIPEGESPLFISKNFANVIRTLPRPQEK